MSFKRSDQEFRRYKEPKAGSFEGGEALEPAPPGKSLSISHSRSQFMSDVAEKQGTILIKPRYNVGAQFDEILTTVKEQLDSEPEARTHTYQRSDKGTGLVSIPSRVLDAGNVQDLQDYFLETKRICTLPKDSKEKVVGNVEI